MRHSVIATMAGLILACFAIAAFASQAGVLTQASTSAPTRTPAVDLPTATHTPVPVDTMTATRTPTVLALTSTSTETPEALATSSASGDDDDQGNGECEKHETPSRGRTGGNHCGQQKRQDDGNAQDNSDQGARDSEQGDD